MINIATLCEISYALYGRCYLCHRSSCESFQWFGKRKQVLLLYPISNCIPSRHGLVKKTGSAQEVINDYLNPVYTIQPVVKRVKQPVAQPVECLFTRCSRWFNWLFNRFDNGLYRVNGVLVNPNLLFLRLRLAGSWLRVGRAITSWIGPVFWPNLKPPNIVVFHWRRTMYRVFWC